MRVRTLRDDAAVRKYPTIPGCVFIAECDAGHAILCCPQPGDFVPMPDKAVTKSSIGGYMAKMPLSMTFLHVRSAYRGQGMGAKLVQACQRFAASRQLPISLRALPYGQAKQTPTLKELMAFYERCGFAYAGKHDSNAYMVWSPATAR
jgi:GNAT superfamily N-acetyltransferase